MLNGFCMAYNVVVNEYGMCANYVKIDFPDEDRVKYKENQLTEIGRIILRKKNKL